jgi:hypothetical protein
MFKTSALAALASGLLCTAAARAGDLSVGVVLAGEITPGVYGQVMVGSGPPPPLVYAQPVLVQPVPYVVRPAPMYLYVPPGHARHWSKHCHEYHACNRPVYFVRGAEYDHDEGEHGHQGKPGHGRQHD